MDKWKNIVTTNYFVKATTDGPFLVKVVNHVSVSLGFFVVWRHKISYVQILNALPYLSPLLWVAMKESTIDCSQQQVQRLGESWGFIALGWLFVL